MRTYVVRQSKIGSVLPSFQTATNNKQRRRRRRRAETDLIPAGPQVTRSPSIIQARKTESMSNNSSTTTTTTNKRKIDDDLNHAEFWSVEGIDEEKNPFDLSVVVKTTATAAATTSTATAGTNPTDAAVVPSYGYYKVHRETLCEHSQYFDTLLRGNFREGQQDDETTKDDHVVSIEFDHPSVSQHFKTILKFMYLGNKQSLPFDTAATRGSRPTSATKDKDVHGPNNIVSVAHAANVLLMDGLLQVILDHFKSKAMETAIANYHYWKEAGEFGLQDIQRQMFRNILTSTANYGDGMFWCSPRLTTQERVEVFEAALTFMDKLTEEEIRSIEQCSNDLSKMIASTILTGQIPTESVTKLMFDNIFKSPKSVSLRAVQEYMEPSACPYGPILFLNMHEKFYPSQILPPGQFKLTACEAWLVKLIKPPTEESLDLEDAAEILEEMSKLPVRVQTISHLLKAIEYLEIEDFVVDEEKEKFATSFPWLISRTANEDSAMESESSDGGDDDDNHDVDDDDDDDVVGSGSD